MTREEALEIATEEGLQEEVAHCIDELGYSPKEALQEWDLI